MSKEIIVKEDRKRLDYTFKRRPDGIIYPILALFRINQYNI